MWPEAKHLTCSVSAQMVKALQSHMQEKTGAIIKLPGDLQLESLLAAQLLMQSNLLTFSLHSSSWWLSHYNWKLGSWLSSLKTGLVSISHPCSKRVKADSVTSQQMRSETQLLELATNIQGIFFPSSPVALMDLHSKSQERFSMLFWGCLL